MGPRPWVQQVPACEHSAMPVTVTSDLAVYYHKIDTRVQFEPSEYCLLSLEPSGQVSTGHSYQPNQTFKRGRCVSSSWSSF